MKALNPTELTEDERLNIMFKIVEASGALWHHGISHQDVAPRNVIICGEPYSSPDLRVYLIDFNMAQLDRLTSDYLWKGDMKIPKNRYPLPISPILRWWGGIPNFQSLPGFLAGGPMVWRNGMRVSGIAIMDLLCIFLWFEIVRIHLGRRIVHKRIVSITRSTLRGRRKKRAIPRFELFGE